MAFDVFISYSTKDKLAADATCAALEAAGVRCWIAPRDIMPGAEWGAAIVKALDHCRVLVLIFSSNANESPQIRREVERAVSKGIPVVPVRIEDIVPTDALAYFMDSVHWLDALTPPLETHLRRLADSVNALLQINSGEFSDFEQRPSQSPILGSTDELKSSPNVAQAQPSFEPNEEDKRVTAAKSSRPRTPIDTFAGASRASYEFSQPAENAGNRPRQASNARRAVTLSVAAGFILALGGFAMYSYREWTPSWSTPVASTPGAGPLVAAKSDEPKVLPVAPSSPGAPALVEDEIFWNAIKTTGVAMQLEEFVKKYPLSPHVAEARARLEEMRKVKEQKKINDQNMVAAAPPLVQPAPPVTQPTQPSVGETSGVMPLSPERERALKPKDSFKECANCPEMVVVPAGSFAMGSPASEQERTSEEGPQHPLTVPRQLGVGRFAVTFDEWDACVADGGCNGYQPSDEDWGRGRRPVINVSWGDAKAYVAWLSKKSGKTYRLLSEAEREYVTRAGTTTPFWWGSSISTSQANYDGTKTYGSGVTGEFRHETLPVDKFQPNPWGLYQVHGNVWEWVEDCYHESYAGAPSDASAWTFEDCSSRVMRGGSWVDNPAGLRAASRGGVTPGGRSGDLSFRVGRTLTP